MKTHYLDAGFAARNRTPCGRTVYTVNGDVKTIHVRIVDDMDYVTCKRCIASWNRFVRDGGAGK